MFSTPWGPIPRCKLPQPGARTASPLMRRWPRYVDGKFFHFIVGHCTPTICNSGGQVPGAQTRSDGQVKSRWSQQSTITDPDISRAPPIGGTGPIFAGTTILRARLASRPRCESRPLWHELQGWLEGRGVAWCDHRHTGSRPGHGRRSNPPRHHTRGKVPQP